MTHTAWLTPLWQPTSLAVTIFCTLAMWEIMEGTKVRVLFWWTAAGLIFFAAGARRDETPLGMWMRCSGATHDAPNRPLRCCLLTAAVLAVLQAVAPTTAVAGNVDDAPGTSLPQHAVVEINGHRVLLHHIVEGKGQGQVTPQAAALIQQQRPDIVVFGHSHRNTVRWLNGRLLVNPGSAGPARFKLPRTIAILEMPPKESSSDDSSKLDVQVITLDAKAPRRAAGTAPSPKRRKAVVKKEAPLP